MDLSIYGKGVIKVKKVLKWIGIIVLVLIVIGAVSGNKGGTSTTSSNTSSAKVEEQPQEPEKISAQELADDFDGNQVAAEAKWKGKMVEFSAEITNITDTGLSFGKVASKEFSLAQISCKITDKQQLLPLKNGQTVTVKGVVGNQTIGVIDVSDCSVVQ
ncbi:hypothetical protein B6D29_00015 [Microgenomates bacterium UTCPR1]|nr:MAG: hypothetical protein B6D29_00015 [Microgenomates bacterium UTCPR1]